MQGERARFDPVPPDPPHGEAGCKGKSRICSNAPRPSWGSWMQGGEPDLIHCTQTLLIGKLDADREPDLLQCPQTLLMRKLDAGEEPDLLQCPQTLLIGKLDAGEEPDLLQCPQTLMGKLDAGEEPDLLQCPQTLPMRCWMQGKSQI